MVSPEIWLEMYSDYKKKIAGNVSNKWDEYEIKMPLDLAQIIATRVESGE